MNTTTQGPQRLYLMQVAAMGPQNVPVPTYLIQTADKKNILIDTGYPRNMIDAYKHDQQQGVRINAEDYVINQLAGIGLGPQDIDILICTHFDPDHAGNHDAFPQAELVVQREHYEVARASDHQRFTMNRAHWDHPDLRYHLIAGDTMLLPGIELIETSGHVPGHQSILVHLPESGPVLLAIDAITMQAQADPERRKAGPFDMDEEGARVSTRKLADIVKREHVTMTVYGHDPLQWQTLKKLPYYYS